MMDHPSDGGKYFRRYTACNLAWWHSFKHGALAIWKRFANDVFAPLWHDLYPGCIFYDTPSSLASVLAHLLYIHQGADHIIPAIRAASQREGLHYASRMALSDLELLVAVAIPVVCTCTHV